MKRSKRFEDVFEECLELVLTRGESIESCLTRYPEQASELRPLIETALLAKRATAVEPSAEFRARARVGFDRFLQETPAPEKRTGHAWSWSWQPRWAAAVGVVVAALLMSGGTVAAAGRAMPGQPLYPVKQATEQTRIALTTSTMGKAELYAQLADRRVSEIVYLADKDNPELVQQVTEQLDSYLDHVSQLTLTVALVTGQSAGSFAAEAGTDRNAAVAPVTTPPPTTLASPPGTQGPFPVTATPPITITQALPPPGEKSWHGADGATYGRTAEQSELFSMLIAQAASNPDRLKAVLDKASPEVRLALLKAIAVSETGYERALQSLVGPQ